MDTFTNANHAMASMILNTLLASLTTGNREMADAMGVAQDDIEELFGLSPVSIAHLSVYADQFLHVQIDAKKLRQLNRLSQKKITEERLITGLLQAGATYEFLNTHFGLEYQEISRRKRRLQIDKQPKQCLKRTPSDAEYEQIVAAYQAVDRTDLSTPQLVYRLHCDTQLNACMIAGMFTDDGQLRVAV